MKLIDRDTVQRKLQSSSAPTLVEALPEKYWRDWHLPGAKHLPHDRVRKLASVLLPDRSAEIVVYCASATCQNSHIAARVLEQLGYGNVAVYAGGKQDWQEAGLPVERGQAVPA
jgi:rhodanese-related sulfurtransferase